MFKVWPHLFDLWVTRWAAVVWSCCYSYSMTREAVANLILAFQRERVYSL